MRLHPALTSLLLLVLAPACRCAPDDDELSGAVDCAPAAVDLAVCDTAGLQARIVPGVWHFNLESASEQAFSIGPVPVRITPGNALAYGIRPMDVINEDGRFFFRLESQQDGSRTSWSVWACEAQEDGRFSGVARQCDATGDAVVEGRFRAQRVGRGAGEAESQGLVKLGELHPIVPGTNPASYAYGDVVVEAGVAYVAAYGNGLFVVDVRNPAAPVQVGHVPVGSEGEYFDTVAAHGSALYLGSQRSGVRVFRRTVGTDAGGALTFSAQEQPRVPAGATGLGVEGLHVDATRNLLFAGSPSPDGSILVFDVTQPETPVLLKNFIVKESDLNRGEVPRGLTTLGDRLYVSHNALGLAVVNVADPRNPADLGRSTVPGAQSRTVTVGLLGDRPTAFDVGQGWGGQVRVLDVSRPEAISQLATIGFGPHISPRSARLAGQTLYVAHAQAGVRRLDVSNPAAPTPTGYFHTWNEEDGLAGLTFTEGANGLALGADGTVYVTDLRRGLLILQPQP